MHNCIFSPSQMELPTTSKDTYIHCPSKPYTYRLLHWWLQEKARRTHVMPRFKTRQTLQHAADASFHASDGLYLLKPPILSKFAGTEMQTSQWLHCYGTKLCEFRCSALYQRSEHSLVHGFGREIFWFSIKS
jgi:hypothetical protein